ncbi:MAG: hypothetical protein HQ537_01530 [Parcubacteria group bacterium]|nr:hypothetical protein [Parcubacteria group bacterium]
MLKNNFKIFSLRLLTIIFLAIFLIGLPGAFILAGSGWGSGFENPLESEDFTELAESIIEWIVNIGILIAVFMIIYSGILFMISRGNDEDITKAKKALMWSLIGLAILIMGKTWITLIESILSGK